MSASAEAEEAAILRPRLTPDLFGHADAEQTLLDAYRSGRTPHAWLIGGERGIGKATLAYRMARFVLAYPDPTMPAVRDATSLAVPSDHPVARRIAGQAHSDLLVLRRVINEKNPAKLYTDIRVDDIRRIVPFFGSTAGEGGWRIAIVDPVEDLNSSGRNALLKVLEEPPPRALLFLVSHAPGRVLPTIRSRCRMLMLRPLASADVAEALAATEEAASPDDIRAAAEAADGSVGRALMLLEGDTLELRQQLVALLEKLPALDPRALHALGDRIAGTQAEPLVALVDAINGWISSRLRNGPQEGSQLARLAEAWASINSAIRDADAYNLDRKPLVFSVFGKLAEAARG